VATALVVLFLIHAPGVDAQIPSASLRGTITDPARGVLTDAKVTARDTKTGAVREVVTDAAGRYSLPSLEPGAYDVEVAARGFAVRRERLVLRVGDELTLDLELSLEPVYARLNVHARLSAADVTDFHVDGIVTREQIESMPLNGRSFLELGRLEPAVAVESIANPGAFGNNYHRVSVAGASSLQTRVTVDGSSVDDRINGGVAQNFSQETIQEFQISTFSFALATGLTGSGAVNVVTRRGGNDLHGATFFYYRDQHLAAYPALRRNDANPHPFFARRQSGFSLEGPLKKDRLFWFANLEHMNQDGAVTIANSHPIFSKLDVTRESPLNFDLFNLRVDGRLDDRNGAFVRVSLDRNDTTAPPSTGTFMPSNWQKARTRAMQVQGGLTSVPSPRLVNELRAAYGRLDNTVDALTASDCDTGPSCLGAGAPFEILLFDAPLFRLGHYLSVPKAMSPRTYDLTDNVTWQGSVHRLRLAAEWEHAVIDGSHAFYDAPQITLYGPTDLLASPALRPLYDALPASLKDPAGPPPTLDDLLQLPVRSMLMGIGNPRQPGPYDHDRVSNTDLVRMSLEHAWTIRPRLTLQYGLRYVYRTDIYNGDLERPAYLAPLLNGDLRPPHRGRSSFDPMAGVVWAIGPKSRTIVRLGGGVYHDDIDFYTPFLERGPLGPAGNGRVVVDGSIAGVSFLSGPTSMAGADLVPRLPAIRARLESAFGDGRDLSVRGIEVFKQGDRIFAPEHTTPYSVHAVFGVQRELTPGLHLDVGLVLRHQVHVGGFTGSFAVDRNRFNRPRVTGVDANTGVVSFVRDPVIPLCTAAQAAALDPKDQCSTGPISVYGSGGTSLYRGLHVKLDERLSSRLQASASYALAKNTGFVELTRFGDPASGYGSIAGQRRHRLTVSGVYQVPEHTGRSGLARALLNSWTVALISQTETAPPLNTLLVGLDLDGDGISRTLLPGTSHNDFGAGLSEAGLRALVAQYNADVEGRTRRVLQADGTLTAVRPRTPFNQVINPITLPDRLASGDSLITQDVRLTRRISMARNVRLQLIAEVFNLFNVANLTGYSGVLNQLGYGQPTARVGQVFGTGGPRAFQLASRLSF
jgi:hypothetical protein